METLPARTLAELFFARARRSGPATAILYKREGRWVPISWDALRLQVEETARGLSDWVRPGDRVAILSENRPEWWVADLAILALGAVTVPVYPTSPPKDVAYILKDSGAQIVFASSAAQVAKVAGLREAGQVEGDLRVISFDDRAPEGGWLLSLADLRTRNPAASAVLTERGSAMEPGALATLVYTSGTTGEPKGVMLSHRNILSNMEGAGPILDEMGLDEFRTLSFLPLSHALERTIGYYMAIRYGFVTAIAESLDKLVENLAEVRPNLLVSVPRIYEKVYARVLGQAPTGPKRRIFDWALDVGRRHARCRIDHRSPPLALAAQYALADRLVFSKIRHVMGGELRFALTGGAPLAPDIVLFLMAAGLTVVEGYGLTEASPLLSSTRPSRIELGTVGTAWPGVELKIAPEEGREGEGEILGRGENVMLGYWNKPEETRAALEPDGWLHTGDIGFIDERGMLHVTDRKKELLKTSAGKYVAPAPIENTLKIDPIIEQAVIIGNKRNYCVALLAPNRAALEARLGRALPEDPERLDADPAVRALFQAAVDRVNEGRGTWEQIKRFRLLPHELTQESGELTPSLKVKRRVVDEKYKAFIDAMYEAPPQETRSETPPASGPRA